MTRTYMCIDLKSFYASVECHERGLDPLTTNLVVADASRTEKTICLAVTPSLKKFGLSGRSRLFEVVQKVRNINNNRRREINYKKFTGKSVNEVELNNNKFLELDYIAAKPRMGYYMKYSSAIYNIYLKYLAPEDIFVYSIDEVFCDVTDYLNYYKLSAKDLATKMIHDVYYQTGITATAGIGTNLYLAKVAMDIVAKHAEADMNGVRIAELDETSYRKILWSHKPITDFWRVGKGYAKKLESRGMKTMGDVARCSINNEELLYKMFGVNAELLIDHAWGWEPCTVESVRSYKPTSNSLSSGQVLHSPYNYNKALIIVKEMADGLALDLVDKHLVTSQLVLTIGYDISNLTDSNIRESYKGETVFDFYGRELPKHSHGTINLEYKTSSSKVIRESFVSLYNKIVNPSLLIRRINIVACNTVDEDSVKKQVIVKQIDLFSNDTGEDLEKELKDCPSETNLQRTMLDLKKRYGKNIILKGMDLEEGATTIDRNKQVGGHSE